jgi:hypothetical protein
MGREIGLVSCTKQKRGTATEPRDLYDESAYFRKMRAYVEKNHDAWYVLSAKHRVLAPDGPPIEPYHKSVSEMAIDERREWANEVFDTLRERGTITDSTTVVIHAGADYYNMLVPLLEETAVTVEIPIKGLAFGETLSWYNDRLA